MGFESSRIARRRLAALASTNIRVHEAVAPSSFPGFLGTDEDTQFSDELAGIAPAAGANPTVNALAQQLDLLAQDIVSTPGAGGALLSAYAAQARALTMVIEAARRAGNSPLPASVITAAQEALQTPENLHGLVLA